MKASELINKLQSLINSDGDLEVWIDSPNEYAFGDVKDVAGVYYSGRASDNPHIYILSGLDEWKSE